MALATILSGVDVPRSKSTRTRHDDVITTTMMLLLLLLTVIRRGTVTGLTDTSLLTWRLTRLTDWTPCDVVGVIRAVTCWYWCRQSRRILTFATAVGPCWHPRTSWWHSGWSRTSNTDRHTCMYTIQYTNEIIQTLLTFYILIHSRSSS